VVNANLAYAVSYDRVLKFDGDFWTQLGGPLPGVSWANALWADASTVVVAAADKLGGGDVLQIASGADPVSLPGFPKQATPFAVWGLGAADVWVGTAQGQLEHYDGAAWTEMATIPYRGLGSKSVSGASGIGKIKLWGTGNRLYAMAGNVFGRWDGARFEVLESLAGEAFFAGLWGNSASEVFLAVVDRQGSSNTCGPLRLRWYDGARVGPL
jgi:hypothetical protein